MEVEMSLTEPNHRTLAVVYQDVSALQPRSTNPILVDDANGVVAGHGRIEAAKIVGLDRVPTVRLSAMSEAEIRAYVIADNRLAETPAGIAPCSTPMALRRGVNTS